jgi:hypothetical protein
VLFLLRFRAGAFVVLSPLVFAMDHPSLKGLTGQQSTLRGSGAKSRPSPFCHARCYPRAIVIDRLITSHSSRHHGYSAAGGATRVANIGIFENSTHSSLRLVIVPILERPLVTL